MPVGTIVRRKQYGYRIKISDDKWLWQSRYVWEQHNGKLPDGKIMLHINADYFDDRLENLIAIDRADLVRINQTIGLAKRRGLDVEGEVRKALVALGLLGSIAIKKEKANENT